MKGDTREIIQRMSRGEPGLHTKTIEPYKIVRMTSLPIILRELISHDIKRKKLELARKLTVNGHKILILRRPE